MPDCDNALTNFAHVYDLDIRARTYKALGLTDKAFADFQRVIELAPDGTLAQAAAEEIQQLPHIPFGEQDGYHRGS